MGFPAMFTPPRHASYLITRKQFRRALADILLDRRAMTAFSSDHIDNCMEEAELRLRFHRDEKSRARRRGRNARVVPAPVAQIVQRAQEPDAPAPHSQSAATLNHVPGTGEQPW